MGMDYAARRFVAAYRELWRAGKRLGKIAAFPLLRWEWQRTDIFLKAMMGIGDHDAEKMMLLIRRDAGLFEKTALVGSKYACVKYWKNEFACIPTELPS